MTVRGFGSEFSRRAWLRVRAAATPEREALVYRDLRVSYGELLGQAESLAASLEAEDVRAGDVVAVLLRNGPDFVRIVHALQIRGAVLLPLNWRLTAAELGYQLRDSGARLLVYAEDHDGERLAAEAAQQYTIQRALLSRGALVAERLGQLPRTATGATGIEGAMALLYTSGTTGRPKGAILGPECFLASADASARLLGTQADDLWLLCMPMFHVGGLSVLTRSCLAGSSVMIHERFEPSDVSSAFDRNPITGVSFVASMLRRVLEMRGPRPAPRSLRCVLLGGGPAPDSLLTRARALGYPVAPTYGLTEATSQVATRLPGDEARPFGARLRPLPGTRVKIVDAEGAVREAGEVGEIAVSGPTLMRGYLGLERETRRALCGGWLMTGDLGRMDAEGGLEVLDRRDDLIVSGGENIYPAEVEAALESHPAVAEAGVVGRSDPQYGARPIAFWVYAGKLGRPAEDSELRSHCRRMLAGYKLPASFTRVESLPRNASGKLLRGKLREWAAKHESRE